MILNGIVIEDKYSLQSYFDIAEIYKQLPAELDSALQKIFEKDCDVLCFIEMLRAWSDIHGVNDYFRNRLAEAVKTKEKKKGDVAVRWVANRIDKNISFEQIKDRGKFTSKALLDDLATALYEETSKSETAEQFQHFIKDNQNEIERLMNLLEDDMEETVLFSCLLLYGLIDCQKEIDCDGIEQLIKKKREEKTCMSEYIEITSDKELRWYDGKMDDNLLLHIVRLKNTSSLICSVTIKNIRIVDYIAILPDENVYALATNKGYIFFFRKIFEIGEKLCRISGNTIICPNTKFDLPYTPVACTKLNAYGWLYLTQDGKIRQKDNIHYEPFPDQDKTVSLEAREDEYCLLKQNGDTESNSMRLRKTDIIRIQPGVGNTAFIKSDYSVDFESGDAPDGNYTCMAVISFMDSTHWMGISTEGALKASFDIPENLSSDQAVSVRNDGFQFIITNKDNKETIVEWEDIK